MHLQNNAGLKRGNESFATCIVQSEMIPKEFLGSIAIKQVLPKLKQAELAKDFENANFEAQTNKTGLD